ncbi:DNA adenine methylase [Croceimicrobium sp.]|uniref:DNA adenine methylase n=1 Tax=Croceimicrobium sp. TaxID=2828340 RepID=UPI003BA99B8D
MGYRYIGAKNKLSDHILTKVSELVAPEAHIVDLMCGTGQVSLALREDGYRVTAVDLMTYSLHHAAVQLCINKPPEFRGLLKQQEIQKHKENPKNLFGVSGYEAILSFLNNLEPVRGYFWKEFSPDGNPANGEQPRKYFISRNAGKIDAIREQIEQWRQSGKISELENSLLIHDLIMAANDIANIAGTYGHYLSKVIVRAKDPLTLKPSVFSSNENITGHNVLQGYAEEISKSIQADLCYIDPPYMKRQYAANYHVLETIARGDKPEAAGVSGLRPWRDQYSNFCSKVHIRDSFRQIFSSMNCPHFLISYSEDGLLKIDELTELFAEFGNVETKEIRYKRFKSNNSKLDEYLTEYLIHLEKATVKAQCSAQQFEHAQDAM